MPVRNEIPGPVVFVGNIGSGRDHGGVPNGGKPDLRSMPQLNPRNPGSDGHPSERWVRDIERKGGSTYQGGRDILRAPRYKP